MAVLWRVVVFKAMGDLRVMAVDSVDMAVGLAVMVDSVVVMAVGSAGTVVVLDMGAVNFEAFVCELI